jgi:tetratricopeptide (TPR) repeat protein
MAQIYFIDKNYEKSIHLYKQILETIEISLVSNNEIKNSNKNNNNNNNERSLQLIKNELNNSDKVKDDRISQMIYFTLSNIGLCMEMLNRFDDARSMFQEQYEMSILLNNPKLKSNALFNLFHLYSNKLKSNEQQKDTLSKKQLQIDQVEFVKILNNLFQVYKELNDVSGQLFSSQSLSFYYHSSGFFKKAIKCYLFNIKYCKLLNETDNLRKSLFNISLCFKSMKNYQDAYKYQLEYFNLINKSEENDYDKFISLGMIADLLFDMDKSYESCQNCIQIHVDRLKIVKNAKISENDENYDTEDQSESDDNFLNTNKHLKDNNQIEKKITNKNKCKLIGDCLESIAKCYYQMENYQQVLKFKLLQIELKNEIESLYHDFTEPKAINSIKINKQKCKIWLDIGNLFLFKFDSSSESKKYFEMVYKMAKEMNDLLLESLTLGNIGLCHQKDGNYEEALEFFQQQLTVLKSKLSKINENSLLQKQNGSSCSSSRASSASTTKTFNNSQEINENPNKPLLKFTNKNIYSIKEIISIRIDIGRSSARLAKCCQLLAEKNPVYINESLKYYNSYAKECLYLFENYAKPYFLQLDRNKNKNTSKLSKKRINTEKFNSESQISFAEFSNDNVEVDEIDDEEDSLNQDVRQIANDLIEQIYLDYDTSLTKLAQYYIDNLDKSIELNHLRLSLLNFCSKYVLEKEFKVNSSILINFTLANLNSRIENRLVKAVGYCENIIKIYDKEFYSNKVIKDDVYLIETLNLLSDVSVIKLKDNKEYEYILENVIKTYKLIWEHNDYYDFKILELKYYTTCRLSAVYKKLQMTKECLEILMDSKNKFSAEFQQLQQIHHNENDSNNSVFLTPNLDNILLHYIEYLFLLHRKIALIHMKHLKSNSKDDNILEKSYMLILKHVNEASTYLKYQKDFQSEHTFRIRQASVYYLLGICYRILKNNEMELEMFANSLDIYENLLPMDDKNSTTLKENSNFNSSSVNILFDPFKNDYDEETEIDYLKRIDELYELIEDSLIKMNKHKEALLVIERHKLKLCSHLNDLQDLFEYNQISELLNEKINLHALLYYSVNKSSSTLNCWLLQPNPNNDIIKFHQTEFKSFDSLILKQEIDDEKTLQNSNENILKQIYDVLIKPFESILFNKDSIKMQCNLTKPLVYIIYDESMIHIPFHLLKKSLDSFNNNKKQQISKYLYEIFEIDCVHSIKYLAKRTYNNKYTKHNQIAADSSLLFPMRVISNLKEIDKIVASSVSLKNSNFCQYDLILILVDIENRGFFYNYFAFFLIINNFDFINKDFKFLNNLINKLISKKITKSVLFELKTHENLTQNLNESEQEAKTMLKKLYSKMINRTTLNVFFILIYDFFNSISIW